MLIQAYLVILVFAVLQNLDNLALAAAYRLKEVEIPPPANLMIAALSAIVTGLSVIAADIAHLGEQYLGLNSASEWLGRGLLLMIGCWSFVSYFRTKYFPQLAEDSEEAGMVSTGRMSVAQSVVPGTALAIDNLGPSFAFAMVNAARPNATSRSIWFVALTTVLSLAMVWLGQMLGARGKAYLRWISPELAFGCLVLAIAFLDPGDLAQDTVTHLTGQKP